MWLHFGMTAANWRVAYLAIRTVAWYLLWFFVWADGLVHRKSRGRGWKLHWGLRGVLTAYVVAEALRLDVGRRLDSVRPDKKNGHLRNDNAFKAYVFFIDTADTLFMVRNVPERRKAPCATIAWFVVGGYFQQR